MNWILIGSAFFEKPAGKDKPGHPVRLKGTVKLPLISAMLTNSPFIIIAPLLSSGAVVGCVGSSNASKPLSADVARAERSVACFLAFKCVNSEIAKPSSMRSLTCFP